MGVDLEEVVEENNLRLSLRESINNKKSTRGISRRETFIDLTKLIKESQRILKAAN